jgi:hypothetical protein
MNATGAHVNVLARAALHSRAVLWRAQHGCIEAHSGNGVASVAATGVMAGVTLADVVAAGWGVAVACAVPGMISS